MSHRMGPARLALGDVGRAVLRADQLVDLLTEALGPTDVAPVDAIENALAEVGVLEAILVKARDELVVAMREAGASWSRVGEVLGVTKQTAHERYGPPREAPAEKLTEPMF